MGRSLTVGLFTPNLFTPMYVAKRISVSIPNAQTTTNKTTNNTTTWLQTYYSDCNGAMKEKEKS